MATTTRRNPFARDNEITRWIAANPVPPRSMPINATVCMSCGGTGTIVSRYGGPGGCFVDEDDCPTCSGAGFIATIPVCIHCDDRGELPVMDVDGEYDSSSVEYCTCPIGRDLEQSEIESHIEAVSRKAADEVRTLHQAHLADQAAYHAEPIPALHELPF